MPCQYPFSSEKLTCNYIMTHPAKVFSTLLAVGGGFLLMIALISGVASILSLIERLRYGPGLLFADVEILGLLALVSAGAGISALWIAKKSSRNPQMERSRRSVADIQSDARDED